MIWRLFLVVGLLAACTDGIPRLEELNDLIPREEMVSLLTDLVKAEAHITGKYVQVNRYHLVMKNTGDSLLNARGVTRELLDRSFDYYGSRQEEMESIYTEVLEELNKELGALEAQKSE